MCQAQTGPLPSLLDHVNTWAGNLLGIQVYSESSPTTVQLNRYRCNHVCHENGCAYVCQTRRQWYHNVFDDSFSTKSFTLVLIKAVSWIFISWSKKRNADDLLDCFIPYTLVYCDYYLHAICWNMHMQKGLKLFLTRVVLIHFFWKIKKKTLWIARIFQKVYNWNVYSRYKQMQLTAKSHEMQEIVYKSWHVNN